jgi:hypothetical protein
MKVLMKVLHGLREDLVCGNRRDCKPNRGLSSMTTNGNGSSAPRIPNLPLTALYERVDKRGRRYLVGRVGNLKLMVFSTKEVSKGDPVWHAFLTEVTHHTPAEAVALARELEAEARV